ncbi:hypothetical protein PDE_07604 [Penicillium oxalicum 114-2]|uniref:Uncharacterized protein n=1 Tax=Penicillium oxalicum (strain 114-2 / CGMCC 5302) TaxID=933388 RepID=S7ZQF1_PENO1|nr:hypothetical protein PDE_07604 [Penicillium oxalicum 114-2]
MDFSQLGLRYQCPYYPCPYPVPVVTLCTKRGGIRALSFIVTGNVKSAKVWVWARFSSGQLLCPFLVAKLGASWSWILGSDMSRKVEQRSLAYSGSYYVCIAPPAAQSLHVFRHVEPKVFVQTFLGNDR